MTSSVDLFVCHGCGASVDASRALPFRCPNARSGDDVDHLLVPLDVADEQAAADELIDTRASDPFLRYRRLLSTYRLAMSCGLSDNTWQDIVGRLDEALARVDGTGFRVTPMTRQAALGEAVGCTDLWVKDETHNVSGSHKGRHLMGVMLYLQILDAAQLPIGENLRHRPLAIASCGNAALAAATVARASDWPIDVFIPPDASQDVVRRLQELGARIHVSERQPGQTGDPCFYGFREAVRAGAIPFSVQGTENGLAVEGGRTLAFEMAETFASAQQVPNRLFVQVGGGALASALAQGFALATQTGIVAKSPSLVAVQTAGCAPLERAWQRVGDLPLPEVAAHRSRYMWPWEATPHSVASGILDDETYDWFEIVKALRLTDGDSLVVGEAELTRAHELANSQTDIAVSATGSAGLAGLLAMSERIDSAAVIFSGMER